VRADTTDAATEQASKDRAQQGREHDDQQMGFGDCHLLSVDQNRMARTVSVLVFVTLLQPAMAKSFELLRLPSRSS
jgi:hypothetical protein